VAAEQRNKAISKVHSILKPFLLRRLKSDVEISLPRKMEMLLYAPMSEEQRRINTQLAEKTLLVGGEAAGAAGWCMQKLNALMFCACWRFVWALCTQVLQQGGGSRVLHSSAKQAVPLLC
jgi:hypothetical protein